MLSPQLRFASLIALNLSVATLVVSPADAAFVNAWSKFAAPPMTAIGSVVAGQTYTLNVVGQSDVNLPDVALLDATGNPNYIGWGYQIYPTTSIDGNYGIAGSSFNIGALVGSYSENPSSPSDYFVLASSSNQKQSYTATQSGTLYATINDVANSYYGNCGGFNVTLGAIPAVQQNYACAEIARTPSASPAATPIAYLTAGHTYSVSATGQINLGGTFYNSPRGTTPYVNGFFTGALLFSYVKFPTQGDLTPLGVNGTYTFTAASSGPLYALVNAAGINNWAAYTTYVSDLTVIPEPLSISFLLSAIGMVWATGGRRRASP